MRFDIVTIFPSMVEAAFAEGMLKRAREAGVIEASVHDLRDWSADRHRKVDDQPFGGGGGMVLRPEPLFAAVEDLRSRARERSEAAGTDPDAPRTAVVLLCPQGRKLDQPEVRRLSTDYDHLILLCGRYEGVDERVRLHLADLEISIGDYVLSGGEIPALVVIESVTRLLPGALGRAESAISDSFTGDLLDFPQYTRPAGFRGWDVPEVLRSGDHESVARWRRAQALERTLVRRPDLRDGSRTTDETRENAFLSAPQGAAQKR
jgi:tRNA (guanine37-N1)-methyltransferase